MNYNNLKEICRVNKISIQMVASETGVTLDGLRKGLERESLAIRFVVPLCKALCITPNQFFNMDDAAKSYQTQNGGFGNTQIMSSNANTLADQLREKDKQIQRLLDLLEKK